MIVAYVTGYACCVAMLWLTGDLRWHHWLELIAWPVALPVAAWRKSLR